MKINFWFITGIEILLIILIAFRIMREDEVIHLPKIPVFGGIFVNLITNFYLIYSLFFFDSLQFFPDI